MLREHLTITDTEAAQLLTDQRTMRLLEPFMKRPLSLSEAAQELGVKLPKLSYHVRRFLELGLLDVACTERRSGRSVKLYSSTAKRFFVPFRLTTSETLEHLFTVLAEAETTRFRHGFAYTLQQITPDWGIDISHGERGLAITFSPVDGLGRPFHEHALGHDLPALFSIEGRYTLDFDTAKALQKELAELTERYRKKQSANGRSYAVRFGITPQQDILK